MKNNLTNKKQTTIPRIGMRIMKSGIAIFLCFLINILRDGAGIVFYSQLAALWCIRDYVSETKKFAFQRTVGTLIGAVYGLLALMMNQCYLPLAQENRFLAIFFTENIENSIGHSFFISVVIVLVLYTTVILGQKQASYFSCVVFLSIVVNHVSDLNPYLFVWNRFLDTMIGIAVGVSVNCITFHGAKKKNLLFLSGLDDTLLAPGGEMSAYSRVELNRMIERGVHFTVSTIRTPASLLEPLRGIKLTLPVIAMDGAALYNIADNSYEKIFVISKDQSIQIQKYFQGIGQECFVNIVMEDVLLIYYEDSDNFYYQEIIEKMRKSPYRNYLKKNGIVEHPVVYFMMIDATEKIEALYRQLQCEELFAHLKLTVEKSADLPDCSLLKIYNRNATKENMLDYLKNHLQVDKIISFGTVEGRYTYTIQKGEFNQVVKLMKKEL